MSSQRWGRNPHRVVNGATRSYSGAYQSSRGYHSEVPSAYWFPENGRAIRDDGRDFVGRRAPQLAPIVDHCYAIDDCPQTYELGRRPVVRIPPAPVRVESVWAKMKGIVMTLVGVFFFVIVWLCICFFKVFSVFCLPWLSFMSSLSLNMFSKVLSGIIWYICFIVVVVVNKMRETILDSISNNRHSISRFRFFCRREFPLIVWKLKTELLSIIGEAIKVASAKKYVDEVVNTEPDTEILSIEKVVLNDIVLKDAFVQTDEKKPVNTWGKILSNGCGRKKKFETQTHPWQSVEVEKPRKSHEILTHHRLPEPTVQVTDEQLSTQSVQTSQMVQALDQQHTVEQQLTVVQQSDSANHIELHDVALSMSETQSDQLLEQPEVIDEHEPSTGIVESFSHVDVVIYEEAVSVSVKDESVGEHADSTEEPIDSETSSSDPSAPDTMQVQDDAPTAMDVCPAFPFAQRHPMQDVIDKFRSPNYSRGNSHPLGGVWVARGSPAYLGPLGLLTTNELVHVFRTGQVPRGAILVPPRPPCTRDWTVDELVHAFRTNEVPQRFLQQDDAMGGDNEFDEDITAEVPDESMENSDDPLNADAPNSSPSLEEHSADDVEIPGDTIMFTEPIDEQQSNTESSNPLPERIPPPNVVAPTRLPENRLQQMRALMIAEGQNENMLPEEFEAAVRFAVEEELEAEEDAMDALYELVSTIEARRQRQEIAEEEAAEIRAAEEAAAIQAAASAIQPAEEPQSNQAGDDASNEASEESAEVPAVIERRRKKKREDSDDENVIDVSETVSRAAPSFTLTRYRRRATRRHQPVRPQEQSVEVKVTNGPNDGKFKKKRLKLQSLFDVRTGPVSKDPIFGGELVETALKTIEEIKRIKQTEQ